VEIARIKVRLLQSLAPRHPRIRAARCAWRHNCDGSGPALRAHCAQTGSPELFAGNPMPTSVKTSYTPKIIKVHPDEESTTDDIFLGYKTPKTAIQAVVSIISHHKVVALGNLATHTAMPIFTLVKMREAHDGSNVQIDIGMYQNLIGLITEILFVLIDILCAVMLKVIAVSDLFDLGAVEIYPLVFIFQRITRCAYYPLNVINIGIQRILKDQYIANLGLAHRDEFFIHYG